MSNKKDINHLINRAIKEGKCFLNDEKKLEDFNKACIHISSLLHDSFTLYINKRYSTATFLAITAIEEVAKLEISLFRNKEEILDVKRSKDILYSHSAKHKIAIQDVIKIGTRLTNVLGQERINQLVDFAKKGELLKLRESSLYFESNNNHLVIPSEVIDKNIGKEIVLLALEVWSDRLVGISNETYELDSKLTKLFEIIKNY
tara:strand:- start:195560 stop:196168 length:609 start_codon:yes stop_codon:yes gene_type:complete